MAKHELLSIYVSKDNKWIPKRYQAIAKIKGVSISKLVLVAMQVWLAGQPEEKA